MVALLPDYLPVLLLFTLRSIRRTHAVLLKLFCVSDLSSSTPALEGMAKQNTWVIRLGSEPRFQIPTKTYSSVSSKWNKKKK